MHRAVLATFTVLAALLALVVMPLTASAAAACPTGWGSTPKVVAGMGTGEIDTVRTGSAECYDRVVVQVDGPAAGYRAEYVDQVYADGSGQLVTVPGGARIQLTVNHPRYSGPAIGAHVANVAGYPVLRSVVMAGSFEGQTTYGVGVRARLPMRMFVLAGPGGQSRIVLDVARSW